MTTERPDDDRRRRAEPARPSGSGPADRVDEVIRAVEELEERPIEEHVGVFESAQVQLRRALDDPATPDEPEPTPGHA